MHSIRKLTSNPFHSRTNTIPSSTPTKTTVTVKDVIVNLATQLGDFLSSLPGIKERPDVMTDIQQLKNYETLYTNALYVHKTGQGGAAMLSEVLSNYNLTEEELGGSENIEWILQCLTTILTIFQQKVFQ
jgi:hypothetical protein